MGGSNSGKFTLAQALLRFFESTDGQILIDSVDISQIGLHDLRSKITVIPKDLVLFDGSVRDNIHPTVRRRAVASEGEVAPVPNTGREQLGAQGADDVSSSLATLSECRERTLDDQLWDVLEVVNMKVSPNQRSVLQPGATSTCPS